MSGGPGEGPGLEQFVDPNADRLIDRVDFVGMIQAFGKGTLLAIISAFVGIVIAARRAAMNFFEAIEDAIRDLVTAVATIPAEMNRAAVEAASQRVDIFGLFAAPVSAVTVLSAFLVIALFAQLWFGGDDFG